MRIAINGLGRIGRAVLKRALDKGVNVVAVNYSHGIESLVYFLKHDSSYNNYDKKIIAGKNFVKVGRQKIYVVNERDPAFLPWKKLGVDIVIEATGKFKDKEGANKHLIAGAKKVLISAPGKNSDAYIVLGVNENTLKKSDRIISMASCTTNCAAPIIKALNDEFGITKGFFTTIHGYTTSQKLLDSPDKDFRRGRSAAINLIPTTTGAAKAVELVIPELQGKLDGTAIRAPVPVGSITDFTIILKKSVTPEEVNKAIKKLSKKIPTVLQYSEDEIVSSDIVGNPHSSIFDSKLTKTNGSLVKLFSWYDNEFGYSCRLVDTLKYLK